MDIDMSNGLRLLSAWIELKYPNDPEPQVQEDLMKWADEIDRLTEENKGLKEYSDSRDESIKVYREEIKELKERLKVCPFCQEFWDEVKGIMKASKEGECKTPEYHVNWVGISDKELP